MEVFKNRINSIVYYINVSCYLEFVLYGSNRGMWGEEEWLRIKELNREVLIKYVGCKKC